ncbi:unnamed protein product [Didymodactylos carnosus]|uniref:Uncharacterized protein n=1 Tax=Didymodactylos carnosus TaxID=1234261 RepID=A0A814S8A8_9BILA|nr:unnamed protein product [Didymodactylos carnosus]CAF1144636.1 unnamed protein product [Didymodactylos carnosus]CAF3870265.1 unnamed protein product [Didymodactylos carnosus]CAF3908230.1 unnamed protein product [Didymodactylos carnosus]
MVCVPCIFIGIGIYVWYKFIEPYVRPLYNQLVIKFPFIKPYGDFLGEKIGQACQKLEQFGEKIGIRMPQSCPRPQANKQKTKTDLNDTGNDNRGSKLYPPLDETSTSQLHQRTPSAPPPPYTVD